MTLLPFQPLEGAKLLLARLPSRRMRDIMERRFGLRGGKVHTLEAIGREYGITRERVRQIEADAIAHLSKKETQRELEPFFQTVREHLMSHGGVMAEEHYLGSLADARQHPHLQLLSSVAEGLHSVPATHQYHARWAVHPAVAKQAEVVLQRVSQDLEGGGKTVQASAIEAMVARHAEVVKGHNPPSPVIQTILRMSRLIRPNVYGEYGLVSWPTVRPRGVRDTAYLVLAKSGKPMHFREVASAIDRLNWSKRRAHPQTVHNELIKDARFVLVGRGLYALAEWGYKPGAVRQVLHTVLKSSPGPLSKEEILKVVLQQRFVKPQTVLLNLQNKTFFRRMDDGRYTLV